MAMAIIKKQIGRKVELEFRDAKELENEVKAYYALIHEGTNKFPTIQLAYLGKHLIMKFRTTQLAREWCLRFRDKTIKHFKQQDRIEALTQLKELYDGKELKLYDSDLPARATKPKLPLEYEN